MDVNLKSLMAKLDETCRRSLEGAAGLCLSRSNYDVEIEHWLLKLCEVDGADVLKILNHHGIDASRVSTELTGSIDRLKTGNSRPPAISPKVVEWVREAWVIASVEFDCPTVRSGHLLLALISDSALSRLVGSQVPSLLALKADTLKAEFGAFTEGSIEEGEVSTVSPSMAQASGEPGKKMGGKTPALDQFTIDLTARARAGEIDPIVGRDFEIRQVIDILTRRRQNNPILTGEAGVGKTAVAEGFALRVVNEDVPEPLANVSIRTLDLGLLQAGAGVKGEFENRLKSVIAEVKASPKPIILFIDEAHTMIGAGGQAGQGDAANLLKPALARGELRTIAATTWSEYRQYFEKDPALARRFQVVKVEEPAPDKAVLMMRGISKTLENHHGLRILDEAIEDAVHLSDRYIVGRQLPDKSVSLLDTACARVAMGHCATPPAIEDLQRHLEHLDIRLDVLRRENATGEDHAGTIAELEADHAATTDRLHALEGRWREEGALIEKMRDIRKRLEAEIDPEVEGEKPASQEESDSLRSELESLKTELGELQGETPLMQPCVDSQAVAEVVASWTGIPVGRMMADEIETVLSLKENMEERVVGQSHGLDAIAQRVRTSRAGLDDPNKPIGVFMLVGPSGVGKTETALALADLLYGGERNIVTINMSEYQDSSTISNLKGSAKGLVGYGEGGALTDPVRRNPYSVVLLDEFEKAHRKVHELFFQIFDKGTLEDSEKRVIDFKNTIILITSNVGTDKIMSLCADPETAPDSHALHEALRPDLLESFAPALLGRMIVIPYYPLSDSVMRDIVRLKLGKVRRRVEENHRARLEYGDDLVATVASRCTEVDSGARNVDAILTGSLLPQMSREFLSRMADGRTVDRVRIEVDSNGDFAYRFDD